MDIQNIKKVIKKIFFLPPVPTLLIAIPSYWFQTEIKNHLFVKKLLRLPFLHRYVKEDVFRAEAALYCGVFHQSFVCDNQAVFGNLLQIFVVWNACTCNKNNKIDEMM